VVGPERPSTGRALRLAGATDAQHERLTTFRAGNVRVWVERYLAVV